MQIVTIVRDNLPKKSSPVFLENYSISEFCLLNN